MNIGSLHIVTSQALPYLALAYAVFFVVIFGYVMSLSRRQSRIQDDLAVLRRALDEQRKP